jgi:hypothetical protein
MPRRVLKDKAVLDLGLSANKFKRQGGISFMIGHNPAALSARQGKK